MNGEVPPLKVAESVVVWPLSIANGVEEGVFTMSDGLTMT
jgi:hypothetical protein